MDSRLLGPGVAGFGGPIGVRGAPGRPRGVPRRPRVAMGHWRVDPYVLGCSGGVWRALVLWGVLWDTQGGPRQLCGAGVTPRTLLVRGDPSQPRGDGRGCPGFTATGGTVNNGGSQSPSIFKLTGWVAQG